VGRARNRKLAGIDHPSACFRALGDCFSQPAVLSSVLWRTAILRATALPLAALGLLGAAEGPSFDMAVAPAGDAMAFRAENGRLAVIGRGRNAFSTEQWLRADADGRLASEALTKANCDNLGLRRPSRLGAHGRP
jgi:competence protein ComEC